MHGATMMIKRVTGVFPGGGGGKKRPLRKANNLTTNRGHCHVICEP